MPEMILICLCFITGINYFIKDKTSSSTLLDSFEYVMLCIDEMIDEGIIITLESKTIIARATMQDTDSI